MLLTFIFNVAYSGRSFIIPREQYNSSLEETGSKHKALIHAQCIHSTQYPKHIQLYLPECYSQGCLKGKVTPFIWNRLQFTQKLAMYISQEPKKLKSEIFSSSIP
jgi:hypothetical protein